MDTEDEPSQTIEQNTSNISNEKSIDHANENEESPSTKEVTEETLVPNTTVNFTSDDALDNVDNTIPKQQVDTCTDHHSNSSSPHTEMCTENIEINSDGNSSKVPDEESSTGKRKAEELSPSDSAEEEKDANSHQVKKLRQSDETHNSMTEGTSKAEDDSKIEDNQLETGAQSETEEQTEMKESEDEIESKQESDEEEGRSDLFHQRGGVTGLSAKPKVKNLRRNIRDILAEEKLDEHTLAAQKEEQLRLMRLQEKRVAMREYMEQQQVERLVAVVAEAAEAQDTSIKSEPTEEEPVEEKSKPIEDDEDIVILSSEDEESTPLVSTDAPQKKPIQEMWSHSHMRHFSDSSESEEEEEMDVKKEGSDDSDSDVVVLSNSEEEEDEDESNSGSHINDAFNTPDVNGQVLVNVGHPEKEDNIYLAPQLAAAVKPHQIGGIRFLYDNIVESLEQFKTTNGFGCILAHSMGLGKTLQVISLTDVFLRYTGSRSVLIIVPINTIQNWVSEYNGWLPEEVAPHLVGQVRPRQFKVFVLNDGQKNMKARAKVVKEWHGSGGVLLMGYELYRQLSLKKPKKSKKAKKRLDSPVDLEEEDINMELLDEMNKALVNPGPDLVICDEGHRIKNAHANISQALKSIRTKRRIVLTGYPLQNSLIEYWCMVDFVRPNYLGTKAEFCNMFERPIQNGQCVDSTPQDVKVMRYRAHVLHSLLEGFVQRRGHSVLERSLPPKYEHVLLCRMLPIQKKLYTAYMSDLNTHKGMANPLRAFAICCKIWNHPDILYNLMRKRNSEYYDLDLDEMVGKPGRPKKKSGQKIAEKQLNGGPSKQPLPPWGPNSTTIRTEPSSAVPSFSSNSPVAIDSTNTVPMTNQSMMPNNSMNGTQSMMGMGYGGYNNMYNMPVQNYNQMPQYPWNYNQNFPRTPHSDPYASTYANSYGHYGATPSVDSLPQTDSMPGFPPISMPESSQPLLPNTNMPESLSGGSYPSQPSDSSCPPYSMASNGLPGQSTYSSTLITPQPNSTETKSEPFPAANGATPTEDESAVHPNTSAAMPGDLQQSTEGLDNPGDQLPEEKKEDLRKEEAPLYFAESAFEGYVPGLLENSSKFVIFFKILDGCLKLGDRLLVFSQSLFTLSLLEEFLAKNHIYGTNEFWARNRTYFRLDGSTSAQEREKLINDFNANSQVRIFLVSTRAGSLGINLVGANRVVVFDASFNPCHDTQAVCRVYRYGQQKTSHIYRLVTDNSLEKRIYDRQINKQGIADRIVDEMNPDAHLSSKEISNLLVEKEDEPEPSDFKVDLDKIEDPVFMDIVTNLKDMLTRAPFTHESLLVDRKDKKLSTAEKRLAKRSYEIEKQANNNGGRGSYSVYQKTATGGLMYPKNLGGLRTMDSEMCKKVQGGRLVIQRPNILSKAASSTPVESLAKQGVSVQQIKIPKDVSIPTNSGDGKPIQLKAGQNVMVIKTLKGMYLRLTDGKIVAIRTGNADNFGLPLEQGGITIVPSTAGNKPKDTKPIIPARRGRPPLSAQYALGQIVPKATKGQMVRVFRKPVISGRGNKSYQTIAVPSHSTVVKKNMVPNMLKELKPALKTEAAPVDDKDKFKTFLPGAGTSGVGKEQMPEDSTKPLFNSVVPKSEQNSLVPPSLPGLGSSEPKKEEPLAEPPISLDPSSKNTELPDKKELPITVPTIPEMILQSTHTPNLSSSLSKMHMPTISESFQNSPVTHITDTPPNKNSMELPAKNPLDQAPMFTNFNTLNREGPQANFPENNASNFSMGLPPTYSSHNQPLFQPYLQHPNTSQSDTSQGDSNHGNDKPWQLPSKQNESFQPPHPTHHSSAMESFNTRQFIPSNPPTTSLSTPITTSSEHKSDPMAAPLLPPMGSSYPQSGLSSEALMSHNFPNYSSAFRRMDFPVAEMQPNQISTTNSSLPPSYSASQSTPNSPYSVYGSYNNLGSFRGSNMNPGYAPYPGQFFPPQYPNTMPNSVLPYPDLPQQQNPYDLYQPPVSHPYTSGSFGQGAPYPPM